MISVWDFIIASLVMSICVSAIVGTLVFCILKKKYDTEVNELKYDNEFILKHFGRLQEKYEEHLYKYH